MNFLISLSAVKKPTIVEAHKTLETLQAAFPGIKCFTMSEVHRAVHTNSIGPISTPWAGTPIVRFSFGLSSYLYITQVDKLFYVRLGGRSAIEFEGSLSKLKTFLTKQIGMEKAAASKVKVVTELKTASLKVSWGTSAYIDRIENFITISNGTRKWSNTAILTVGLDKKAVWELQDNNTSSRTPTTQAAVVKLCKLMLKRLSN